MEANVRQYVFTSSPVSVSWPKKAAVVFVIGWLMFILRWAGNGLFNWPHESLVHALSTSILFGALYAFLQFNYRLRQRLIIGHNFIEARTQTGSLRFKKRISREKIKSISENRRGLCVMDRREFGARMLGFVFVPATMPEYQEIRSELALWAPIKVKNW
jgi:hypothetical protein